MMTTSESSRDGRADFGFLLGNWSVENRRLKARLRDSMDFTRQPSSDPQVLERGHGEPARGER
jgi:hypothetical protein